MTIKEALKKALDERNVTMAGKISDQLWHKHGWNYNRQVELVESMGYSARYWEELMYEADWQEGHG